MLNHILGVYEENKILKILWRWYWKNVKEKMDVKVEVLSMGSQVRWRISKINSGVCHGKFKVQHIFKGQDRNAYGCTIDHSQCQEEDMSPILERKNLST